jgi:hypothetical protein
MFFFTHTGADNSKSRTLCKGCFRRLAKTRRPRQSDWRQGTQMSQEFHKRQGEGLGECFLDS